MKRQIACLLAFVLAVAFIGCRRSGAAIELVNIAVPSRVFSISGEVLAFEARGESGRKGEVAVSLKRLQSRFGGFKRALVYEYNPQGSVASRYERDVAGDGSLNIDATSGNRYLIFADLGQRFRNTYAVACNLRRARLSGTVIPRVCTQIFCTDNVFSAAQLKERVPELRERSNLELGDATIGGFEFGGGPICEQCLGREGGEGDFVPAAGCSDIVSPDDFEGGPEVIIFTRPVTDNEGVIKRQVFKINSDGTGEANLSNTSGFASMPDVNHQTKRIVFVADGPAGVAGITIMDVAGQNRTVIPGTAGAHHPAWSHNDESFVLFVQLAGNPGNQLRRIRVDGSDNVSIVSAGEGRIIDVGESVDDNHVIFQRHTAGTFDGDIFIKDMRNDDEAINLTQTEGLNEKMPVVSHDGTMIAYLVDDPNDEKGMWVQVDRLTLPSTRTSLFTIQLGLPAGRWLSGLDFSSDDKRIYVSSTEIATENGSNQSELFSIKLDSTGQFRITNNEIRDFGPSVVPR